jgi:LytS/YehU family sensor histidine kinase
VPPLLLQPLVENAIKHGLEPHVAGGRIEVAAAREGDRLRLVVRDTGAGLRNPAATATDPSRFGLANVRQRLHTVYGAGAALDLAAAEDVEGGTRAVISLPLKAPPHRGA